jgi:hypothetical protein
VALADHGPRLGSGEHRLFVGGVPGRRRSRLGRPAHDRHRPRQPHLRQRPAQRGPQRRGHVPLGDLRRVELLRRRQLRRRLRRGRPGHPAQAAVHRGEHRSLGHRHVDGDDGPAEARPDPAAAARLRSRRRRDPVRRLHGRPDLPRRIVALQPGADAGAGHGQGADQAAVRADEERPGPHQRLVPHHPGGGCCALLRRGQRRRERPLHQFRHRQPRRCRPATGPGLVEDEARHRRRAAGAAAEARAHRPAGTVDVRVRVAAGTCGDRRQPADPVPARPTRASSPKVSRRRSTPPPGRPPSTARRPRRSSLA